MEIEQHSGEFYRRLLHSAKVFLTEIDERSSSTTTTTANSFNPTPSPEQPRPRSQLSSSTKDPSLNRLLKSTRQQCHQRLLTCSRKKLRLLSLQEQVSFFFSFRLRFSLLFFF